MNIQSIKNVNSTLNAPIFKSNAENYSYASSNSSESHVQYDKNLLTAFAGSIKRSIELLFPSIVTRAQSIEARLDEFKRLNVIV